MSTIRYIRGIIFPTLPELKQSILDEQIRQSEMNPSDFEEITKKTDIVYQEYARRFKESLDDLEKIPSETELLLNTKILLLIQCENILVPKNPDDKSYTSQPSIEALKSRVSLLKGTLQQQAEEEDDRYINGFALALTKRGIHLEEVALSSDRAKMRLPNDVSTGLEELKNANHSYRLIAQALLHYLNKTQGLLNLHKGKNLKRQKLEEELKLLYIEGPKLFPDFQLKRSAYKLLESEVGREIHETDFQKLTPILDQFGIIRVLEILECNYSAKDVVEKLAQLINSTLLKELPPKGKRILIMQAWIQHCLNTENALKKIPEKNFKDLLNIFLDLPKDELAHKKLTGDQKHGELVEYYQTKVMCTEFLIVACDPTGIKTANALSNKLHRPLNRQRVFGITQVIHTKFALIKELHLSSNKTNEEISPHIEGAFMQILEQSKQSKVKSFRSFESRSFESLYIPDYFRCFPSLTKELSKDIKQLVATIYHDSAKLFSDIPSKSIYSGEFKSSEAWNLYVKFTNKLPNFILLKILEKKTIAERAEALIQVIAIANELLEAGDLSSANCFFNNPVFLSCQRFFRREKEEVLKSHEHLYAKLDKIFSSINHRDILKEVAKNHENLVIPNPADYISDIETAIEAKSQWEGWVHGNRLLRFKSQLLFKLHESSNPEYSNLFYEIMGTPDFDPFSYVESLAHQPS